MIIKPNKTPYNFKYPNVTQEKIDRILADIKRGSPRKYAAEANQMSEAHFYNLVNQGICDINHGNFDTIHARMVGSLRKIEQEFIISAQDDIRGDKSSHKGAEWMLEHAYWRTFSKDGNLKELAEEMEREKGVQSDEVRNKERCEKNSEEKRKED